MIPLTLPAISEAERPFITRLQMQRRVGDDPADSLIVENRETGASFAGARGLVAIDGASGDSLDGDILLVHPQAGVAERILRAGSAHNTLLVTERCDQLCVMCSQPPKKTHVDRFQLFEEACLLAEPGTVIGISGGEPTLYKAELLGMIERVLQARADLEFHVLTNAQHFEAGDIERLRDPVYRRVTWGIPLYAASGALHDEIVGKHGAFVRLEQNLATLALAGARIELRTVLLASNIAELPALARRVTTRLRFIEAWSIMQLENIGFARNRWHELYADHRIEFGPVMEALDRAQLHGIAARLFNFPRCTVPHSHRDFAAASISDWKRKFMRGCEGCREQQSCSGFFEWHPEAHANASVSPL